MFYWSDIRDPNQPRCSLVTFYHPTTQSRDPVGNTLDEILGWSDDKLERHHEYIQTLFPLPEYSVFNPLAPVVNEETMLTFVQSPEIKRNLIRALKRMLAFYGFDATDAFDFSDLTKPTFRLVITPKESCEPGFARWNVPHNHNHLRITRIIRSLRVLGLEGPARDFYNALSNAYVARWGLLHPVSIGYWSRAMKNPLYLAPSGNIVTRWLERYSEPPSPERAEGATPANNGPVDGGDGP